MIKAILFDMDGLVFDTESVNKTCWQQAALQQDLLLDDAYYQTFIGVRDTECEQKLINTFQEKFDLNRFRKDKQNYYSQYQDSKVEFKDGFHKLFDCLKRHQLKCALVTSSPLSAVEHYFSESPYLKQFDAVITSEDVSQGKPNPECYRLACEEIAVQAKHCLVLEDSNNGMKAGLDAGCLAAIIPDLAPPSEEISRQANFIFESLNDVISLIDATCIEAPITLHHAHA